MELLDICSYFFTKFIIKHATGHPPFPVAAKCRWCIYSCRIWQTQIILCRNNAKIRNTSHRQRNQIPCQFFLRGKPAAVHIAKCHILILFFQFVKKTICCRIIMRSGINDRISVIMIRQIIAVLSGIKCKL